MRTENDFNQFITAQIRKLGSHIKAFKTSDRFHIGASDWMIFQGGRAVVVEAKFAKPFKTKGAALGHKISGPQQTFMKCMGLAGVAGWYLIGAGDVRKMYVVPAEMVGPTGQLYWQYLLDEKVECFDFSEVAQMVGYLFGGAYEPKGSEDQVPAASRDGCTGSVLQPVAEGCGDFL